MLTGCSFQLIMGRVYTSYNPKKVFLSSVAIDRTYYMRSCSKFRCIRRVLMLWYLLWRNHHHHEPRSITQETRVAGVGWGCLRNRVCSRSPTGRCPHNESDLEVVFLHQYTHRRCDNGRPVLHSQDPRSHQGQHAVAIAIQAT